MRTKQQAKELAAKQICLGCDEQYREGEQIRRGLCPRCSNLVTRNAKKGVYSLEELEENGLLLPGEKGGRKKQLNTPLAKFTEDLRLKKLTKEADKLKKKKP